MSEYECVFLKMCVPVKLHMCWCGTISQCLGVPGFLILFFMVLFSCVFQCGCSQYVGFMYVCLAVLPCSSAELKHSAYVLKPLAALMHPVLSLAHLVSFYQNAGGPN